MTWADTLSDTDLVLSWLGIIILGRCILSGLKGKPGRHATTSEQSAAAVEGLAPCEQSGRDDRHGLRDGVGGGSDQTVTVVEVYFEEESAPDSWTAFRDPRVARIDRSASKRVN